MKWLNEFKEEIEPLFDLYSEWNNEFSDVLYNGWDDTPELPSYYWGGYDVTTKRWDSIFL